MKSCERSDRKKLTNMFKSIFRNPSNIISSTVMNCEWIMQWNWQSAAAVLRRYDISSAHDVGISQHSCHHWLVKMKPLFTDVWCTWEREMANKMGVDRIYGKCTFDTDTPTDDLFGQASKVWPEAKITNLKPRLVKGNVLDLDQDWWNESFFYSENIV